MAFAYRGRASWIIAAADLTNGQARLPGPFRELTVQFSDGLGWEHVSVSTTGRTPNWDEMCFVKAMFWDDEDCVMQLHPPRSVYVNVHRHCLHLWRPNDGSVIPQPPTHLVG